MAIVPRRELFVGRATELARAERSVDVAIGGGSALILFYGEPGLGKTRMVQAVAGLAAERGARVAWGRAWESGGAPSYWPWIQIFRALGGADDPFKADETAGTREQMQARFARFDKAARWLKDEARERPLVVVLDDLHAADVPSLLFLHFLAKGIESSRLVILGTYRDVEARLDAEIGGLLAKIAREGEAVPLARLSSDDVLAWLCAASGDPAETVREDADRVHAMTEGNPLFVHELLRVRGRPTIEDATKAFGLRAILDEHLARLTSETRAILEVAAVLGRDVDAKLVATLSGHPIDDVERSLREARDLGLLASVSGGERLAFAHILLRERLYAELLPTRRADLHTAAAEAVLDAGGDLATASHHLFESSSHHARIAEIALRAAKSALSRLAFEDAIVLCERALTKQTTDDALTVTLEITCGEALMRLGKPSAGREICVRATRRAQRIGDPTLVANAALAYATELATGDVDPVMVELLQIALDALPTVDSPLRARVLARHAASLVPPRTRAVSEQVTAQGAAALEMARRSGDVDTLLFTLTYAGAAAGYLVSSERRAELMRELVTLARTLDRPLEQLAIGGWWVSTLRERGLLAESASALEDYTRLVNEFRQPYFGWRLSLLKGTLAALELDFDRAKALGEEALETATEGELMVGRIVWCFFQWSLANCSGDFTVIRENTNLFEQTMGRIRGGQGFLSWFYAVTGREEKARAYLAEIKTEAYHFPFCLMNSETVCLVGDVELARHFYPYACEHASKNPLFWGPYGSVAFGPTQRVVGDLAHLLGRYDEARHWYEEAREYARRINAPALAAVAEKRLHKLGTHSPASAPIPSASRANAAIGDIDLHREGEMWRVSSSSGVTFHLKDSKGLHYLGHLLERSGRETHVTDLVDLGVVSGDAGPALDGNAKAQYRQRLEELKDHVEEAQRFGDTTRAAAAQAEIDAIADELAGAVGLGGRDRKLGSHVERIRINVQRRIRDAIQRITEHDPDLGRYLAATVKTGVFCSFSPV